MTKPAPLYGTADTGVGTEAFWRRAIAALPNGRRHVVRDAGHMLWLEDLAGVARGMESFLSESSPHVTRSAQTGETQHREEV